MPIEDASWPRADQWLRRFAEPGSVDGADVLVFGVPTAAGSLAKSRADLAPTAIMDVLGRFSTFHTEYGVDLRALHAFDMGDWDLAGMGMQDVQDRIRELVWASELAPVNLFLGGDNAITRPVVQGASLDWTESGVLTFDARHDARSLDFGPTNGTAIRGLIEDGLAGRRIAQVGVHSFADSAAQRSYCEEREVTVRTMADVDRSGIDQVVEEALATLAGRCEHLHVDFDLGVLDLSFAPGCPGALPGGMTPRQLARAAFLCGRHPRVVTADLVEVDPSRDASGVTVMTAAHVMLSFLAGVAARGAA